MGVSARWLGAPPFYDSIPSSSPQVPQNSSPSHPSPPLSLSPPQGPLHPFLSPSPSDLPPSSELLPLPTLLSSKLSKHPHPPTGKPSTGSMRLCLESGAPGKRRLVRGLWSSNRAGGDTLATFGPCPAGASLQSHPTRPPPFAALPRPHPTALCPLRPPTLWPSAPQAPNKALASILGKSNLRFAGMSIAVSISTDGLNLSVAATRQVRATWWARAAWPVLSPRRAALWAHTRCSLEGRGVRGFM